MVIRVVKKGQFKVVIRVVKRGQFSICNCMRLSRIIKDKFSLVCSKFSQNCLRCTATGAICENFENTSEICP